jgi:acyl carrier protein
LSGGAHLRGQRMVVFVPGNSSETEIRDWCVKYLARTLDLPEETVDPDAKFARLGLDSANSLYLIVELEEWLGIELTSEVIFEYPSIAELARHLARRATGENSVR